MTDILKRIDDYFKEQDKLEKKVRDILQYMIRENKFPEGISDEVKKIAKVNLRTFLLDNLKPYKPQVEIEIDKALAEDDISLVMNYYFLIQKLKQMDSEEKDKNNSTELK